MKSAGDIRAEIAKIRQELEYRFTYDKPKQANFNGSKIIATDDLQKKLFSLIYMLSKS
jgi:hypothetical protein